MDILEEYKANYELYHAFETAMLDDVLNKVLKYERLNIQLVTSRLKEPTSLGLKISSGAKYKALTDVTDVLGLRIVTTYKNEVPFIVQQLRDAFEIDEANTNTNDAKTESEFGYSSIHLIVFNAKDDTYKTNNKKFHGLKAEIQIRTILQHAWAEISHKIDYKAKEKPGSIYKRKLFRVAAFLELADQEFS
jgi:putative GTP pyrophosphokinase